MSTITTRLTFSVYISVICIVIELFMNVSYQISITNMRVGLLLWQRVDGLAFRFMILIYWLHLAILKDWLDIIYVIMTVALSTDHNAFQTFIKNVIGNIEGIYMYSILGYRLIVIMNKYYWGN